jgi:hypothetical protein
MITPTASGLTQNRVCRAAFLATPSRGAELILRELSHPDVSRDYRGRNIFSIVGTGGGGRGGRGRGGDDGAGRRRYNKNSTDEYYANKFFKVRPTSDEGLA